MAITIPPHVHVYGGGHAALICIEDCEYLAGSLPPRIRQRVVRWIVQNRAELLAMWRTYRSG